MNTKVNSNKIQINKRQTLLTWQLSPTDISRDWFDPEYWQKQNKIYAQKQGRATTWFFHHQDIKGVLRHYWRGGLIGKLLQDQYFYLGFKNTRVYREFELLTLLDQMGLKVPRPIAAYVNKSGLIYRGDIITRAIEGAASLLDILKQRALLKTEITKVALCIAQFHHHGVYHADLNINNILFDDNNDVYLIDFDRGEIRVPKTSWQQANIARLERSFNKEADRNSKFFWSSEDWDLFIKTYKGKSLL